MKGILWHIFLYGFFVEDFLFATWGIILRFEGSETHLPSFTALRLPGCQAGPWKGTMFTTNIWVQWLFLNKWLLQGGPQPVGIMEL